MLSKNISFFSYFTWEFREQPLEHHYWPTETFTSEPLAFPSWVPLLLPGYVLSGTEKLVWVKN